ncbi:hypothetical protein IAT38_008368 [Cryptococcus sp. DSM 104549]
MDSLLGRPPRPSGLSGLFAKQGHRPAWNGTVKMDKSKDTLPLKTWLHEAGFEWDASAGDFDAAETVPRGAQWDGFEDSKRLRKLSSAKREELAEIAWNDMVRYHRTKVERSEEPGRK